jgi:hypothetical protein
MENKLIMVKTKNISIEFTFITLKITFFESKFSENY